MRLAINMNVVLRGLILPLLAIAWLSALGQTEAISPTYTFNIRKKIEPPILSLVPGSLQFVDEDGNEAIDALESCAISFAVSNEGLGDGLGLRAVTTLSGSAAGIGITSVANLPTAKLGHETTFEVPLTATRSTSDGTLEVRIEVEEPNGFGLDPITVTLETRAFRTPEMEVVDYKLRGVGQLKRKVPFAIELLVQNVGQGLASDVTAQITIPNNVFLLSSNETSDLGVIQPGETASLVFECIINNNFEGEEVPFSLQLDEQLGKYGDRWHHSFRFDDAMSTDRLVVTATEQKAVSVERGSLSSDVDKNIPDWGEPVSHRYAVVIGNEDYASRSVSLNPEVNVDFAVNDALVMAAYLKSVFGVPEENLRLITDATAGEMQREINWLENVARAEGGSAEIYFYYSGHGLPYGSDNIPYLIPVDVDGQQPQLGVSLPVLYAQLTRHPVKRAQVFLDACFSGGARNEELVAMKGVRVVPKKDAIPDNMLVWASSSGSQASGVFREQLHGHFTYQLLKALQVANEQVILGDLFDQIRRQVDLTTAREGFQQIPQALAAPTHAQTWPSWTIR
ncbi:MAG: hypothetical protein CBD69_006400 [Crocinitomicaceae bacterium TMED209]|nr:MAG: hypothetical protein CBD69_006400 [Crocinitomicaceae bacterium TMED209]